MTKALKKKTFKGFLWLLAGSGSQSILQILVLSILARLISPEEFGVVGIAVIFLGFSKIFSQLGMGPAIIQKQEISKNHIRTAYTVSIFVGLTFCLLTQLLSDQIATYFEMPELKGVLQYVSYIFILDSVISIPQSLLQRKLKMKLFALSEFISYFLAFGCLGVILANLDYGIYALVYAYILQAALRLVIVYALEPHSLIPYFNKKCFYDLVFFGGGHTLARVANYIAGQGDKLVVGKILGAGALGFYSKAYQIMVAPVNLIGQSLNIVLFPALASVQSDLERVKKAYYKSVQLVAFSSLIISAILMVNAREIVLILLGPDWLEVVAPFQILAFGTLFRMSYKVGDSLIKALGDVYRRGIIQVIYAICVFLFSYIGHFWGIIGVAMGVVVAIFINFVLMTYLSLLQFKDDHIQFARIHLKPAALSLIVFIFAFLVLKLLRLLDLNLIITELIFLLLVFGFTTGLIWRYKNLLGISQEVKLLVRKFETQF